MKEPLAMNDRRQPPLRRFTLTRFSPERRDIERRESPRFPVTASVRFLRTTADTPDVINGDVIEASLTGIRVELDQPVRKGEQLLIEVTSQFNGGFNVTAQIMWVEIGENDRHIAGCEFCTILSLKQRAQLQRLAEESLCYA
jgi:hypothetical protein